jgi:hypothetical protein
MHVNVKNSYMCRIVGKNGTCFNAITHQTEGVIYIWHHITSNIIEIYGLSTESINNAENKIVNRIKMITTQ